MRNDFESNYLQHWGIKKGSKKENHKYYERVEKNGKYLYFYTQAEYEAWLHKGNKTLDSVGKKAKNALSDLKNKLTKKDTKTKIANTRSSLLNAIARGRDTAYQLANRASINLTKSNVNRVIDRGTKKINSILNQTSNKATAAINSLQKNSKATSANVSKKARSIADRVSKTFQNAGKNTQKVIKQYVDKGEKTIKQTLAKSGTMSLNSASKKYGNVGGSLINLLVAKVVAPIIVGAATVVSKVVGYSIRAKKEEEKRQESAQKKREMLISESEKTKQEKAEKREQFSKDAKDSFKEDPDKGSYIIHEKDAAMSKDEDMRAVNPQGVEYEQKFEQLEKDFEEAYERAMETGRQEDWDRFYELKEEYFKGYDEYYGYLNNCANCSLTYDLRRRGYDVTAPWNSEGTSDQTVQNWYKLKESDVDYWDSDRMLANRDRDGYEYPFTTEESKEIVNDIKTKYPEGSYGHMMLVWEGQAGGHDCIWSVENGEVIIRECQTGKIIENPDEYLTKACQVGYFRADDKELTDNAYKLAEADMVNEYGQDVSDSGYYNRKRERIKKGKY